MLAKIVNHAGEWVDVELSPATSEQRARALSCARGRQQRAWIEGSIPWELANLPATKRAWLESYESSREGLRARLAQEFGKARLVVVKLGQAPAKMRLLVESGGKWFVF